MNSSPKPYVYAKKEEEANMTLLAEREKLGVPLLEVVQKFKEV